MKNILKKDMIARLEKIEDFGKFKKHLTSTFNELHKIS